MMKYMRTPFKSAVLLLLFMIPLLLSSCNEPPTTEEGQYPNTEESDDIFVSLEDNPQMKTILRLVNEVRSEGCKCGDLYYGPVNPVTWNETVEEAAQNHSDDMYENNFFDHYGSDGSTAGVRLADVGYQWSAYGENIAMGYVSAESVFYGWLGSKGHCENIMSPNVTHMGTAVRGVYWTQVFARPSYR